MSNWEVGFVTSLQPGDRIGILGGGQLGRMLAAAAAQLGFRCHIYCPDPNSPAFQLCDRHTVGRYDDQKLLAEFAAEVEVITYEFENVPASTARFLSTIKALRPGLQALETAQDRLLEKNFISSLGIATAPYCSVDNEDDLRSAAHALGFPCIFKTRRFGYDGKGQAILRNAGEVRASWARIGGAPSILEGFIRFERELAICIARSPSGECRAFAAAENRHQDHILVESFAPAEISPRLAEQAEAIAKTIAVALDYVGVLAVEFFLDESGLRVNEIAPRVHNSGHWTLDAAVTSQFEQHIRAISGLPLGATDALGKARMLNLVGEEYLRWPDYLADPYARVHLYGKGEVRPGRKLGHVTWLNPIDSQALT
jgi:5-(carboxyamino)imidazole ribonucleotide synthase